MSAAYKVDIREVQKPGQPEDGLEGILEQRFAFGALLVGAISMLIGLGYLAAAFLVATPHFGKAGIPANLALGLFLAGTVLVILTLRREKHHSEQPFWLCLARVLSAVVLAIGAVALLRQFAEWNFGIAQLSQVNRPSAGDDPVRSGAPAMLCLILTGTASLLFTDPRGRGVRFAQVLAFVTGAIGLLGVIASLYQVRGFYALERLTTIAWPVAVAALLLGFGLLFLRPKQGFMAPVTSSGPGGVMLRGLPLSAIVILILLGWVRLLGEHWSYYDAPLGNGLLVFIFSMLFCGLVYVIALRLNRVASAEIETQLKLQRQAQLIDLSPAGTIVRDLDGTIRFWSDGARRLYGWTQAEALGRTTHQLLQTEFSEHFDILLQKVTQQGRWSGELRHHTKDGRTVDVQSWWLAEFAPDGTVRELLESNVDITERKSAEAELQRRRALLAEAEKLSHTGAWEWNLETGQWTCSDEWLRMHGCADRPSTPEAVLSLAHPDDRSSVSEAFARLRNGSAPYDLEHRIIRLNDRQERFVHARGQCSHDPTGRMIRVYGFAQDITEQKRFELALKQNEERLRSVLENMSEGLMLFDQEQNLVYQNPASLRIHGFNPAEAGQISRESLPVTWQAWDKSERPVPFENWPVSRVFRFERFQNQVLHVRRVETGQEFFGSYNGSPILNDQGRLTLGFITIRDISEQVRAERELLKTREDYRLLVENQTDMLARMTRDGRRLYVNPNFLNFVGKSEAEVLNTDYSPEIHPNDAPRINELWKKTFEPPLYRSEIEARTLTPTGWRWCSWRNTAVLDEHGEPSTAVCVGRDITELKRAEDALRSLKNDLERRVRERTAELTDANQELEAFGYSVSHDLRAPLRHIDSYSKQLEKSLGPNIDDKSRKSLRIVIESVKRMGNLLDDLLSLSRLGRATMEERPVSLRHLFDEARQELAPVTNGRSILWRVAPLPEVHGDPSLLHSAIANLLGNAVKYSRDRDPAIIEIGCREEPGEIVCFVRDNGAGFDMRFVDKLFGVFQRLHTAQQFEGTGIGLASVRRVIQRHGGRTWAEGRPGQGATFYFTLPLNRVIRAPEADTANEENHCEPVQKL